MSGAGRRRARWLEQLVTTLDEPGARGVALAEPAGEAGTALLRESLPPALLRERPPTLPRLSQQTVVRHFLCLAQESLGGDLGAGSALGTCTLKYSPKVHDELARLPAVRDAHPLQHPETLQGLLRVVGALERALCALTGMTRFSFQAGGGTQAIFANCCMIRAYHAQRGELEQRREIVTTLFSHPGNAAAASSAGFDVVTLQPEADGLPSLAALRAAVSERTAGLLVTNPEDTGVFNPRIDGFTAAVRDAGGVCAYDQANANGTLTIARARDAGFDLCQLNLHKTFSSPHGAAGLAVGAMGASDRLSPYLPVPLVRERDGRWTLDDERPRSIGKVRSHLGVVPTLVRAYAWIASLGEEGLRTVAQTAVLNANYLFARLTEVPGLSLPYDGHALLEQTRGSWQGLRERADVGTEDVARRLVDHGALGPFSAHHPWVTPEPMTFEPTESPSQGDLDRYAATLREVAEEALRDPDAVRGAPHAAPIHRLDDGPLEDLPRAATTWRALVRKRGAGAR